MFSVHGKFEIFLRGRISANLAPSTVYIKISFSRNIIAVTEELAHRYTLHVPLCDCCLRRQVVYVCVCVCVTHKEDESTLRV